MRLAGSWVINLLFALVAGFIIFIGNVTINLMSTALTRTAFAMAGCFIIAYGFRWLWAIAFHEENKYAPEEDSTEIKNAVEATSQDEKLNHSEQEEPLQAKPTPTLSDEETEKTAAYVKELLDTK
ncbi:hypothetical protein [Halalkalibacterium ligniniphilum]|uniref:hypothetical protein n=1 Tax=Halalkalibacterium ligniniphilum TaxID=1134413 RepID=UPI00035FE7CF|nr:hypothetical protein [Halalkalibacterium ligniniphilum]